MKIADKPTHSQTNGRANSITEASGRFDSVLKSKPGNRSDRAARQTPKDEEELRLSEIPPEVIGITGPLQTSAAAEPEHVSSFLISPDTMDVEKLATEIVEEIRSSNNTDGRQSLEIQFNSKILQGLRVCVAGPDKSLSITFSTQSDAVATLLSQHSDELIDRLQEGGVTIGKIGIVKIPGKYAIRDGRQEGHWKRALH